MADAALLPTGCSWSSSITGEPNVVPKFTQVASAYRRRFCLYAWHGSLPRSSSEDAVKGSTASLP